MAGSTPRYRFILVEEPETTLPVRFRRSRPMFSYWMRRSDPMEVLLEAFLRLSRRGEGDAAWAPALADNPLVFLLDSLSDAVVLRQPGGERLYANPAARRMGVEADGVKCTAPRRSFALERVRIQDSRYERRCMTFGHGQRALVLEVWHKVEKVEE